MKKLFNTPGLSPFEKEIRHLVKLSNNFEMETLGVAKVMAGKIVNMVDENHTRSLILAQAWDGEMDYNNCDLPLDKTFLEIVMMKAICSSQNYQNFSNSIIWVKKQDLEKDGLDLSNEKSVTTVIEKICNDLTAVTNRFITCGLFTVNNEKHPDTLSLWANCNFTNKLFPTALAQY